MELTRRQVLTGASLTAGAAILAACQPKIVEVEKQVTTVVKEVVKETVIVEGTPQVVEVEKEVTRVVEAAKEPVEITYLVRSDIGQGMKTADEEIVRGFEEKYTDIKVNLIGVPWGDYNAKLLAMFAGGTPPEVSVGYAAGFVSFYNNGAISAIDDYVDAQNLDMSNLDSLGTAIVTREGKLWGFPVEIIPYTLFYRPDLLQEAGLELPPTDPGDTSWTMSKAFDYAKKLAKDTDDPTKAQYGIFMGGQQLGNIAWVWTCDAFNDGKGGPTESEAYKTGAITETFYTQPRMIEAFQFIQDLIHVHKVMPSPSSQDAIRQAVGWPFLSGKIGMWLDGQWSTTNFVSQDVTDWEYAMAPYPYGPYGSNTMPAGDNAWFLGAQCAHPDEGFDLCRYIGLEEGCEAHAIHSGFFPSNAEYQSYWFDAVENTNLAMTREQLEEVCIKSLDLRYAFCMPGKNIDRFPEWNKVFGQTTGPIWSAEATVEEGLQACQDAMADKIASM